MTDALERPADCQADEVAPQLAVRLHRIDGVREILDVSKRYVEELVADGTLRTVRFGRLVRIRDDDLAAFIESRTEGAA